MKNNSLRFDVNTFVATGGLFLLLLTTCARSAIAQTNTFPATGNAGIGTTSPTAPFTISTPGNTLDGTYYSTMTIRKTGDTFSGIRFDKNSTAQFRLGTDTNNNFQIGRFVGTGAPDDGAFYMNQSGYIGIGTTNPLGRLHTVASGASNFLYLDAYGTGNMPLIYSRVARGSATAPTALANGDLVYDSRSLGYDGTAFQNISIIRTSVDGTVSAGIVPGRFQFFLTNASGMLNEVMRIDKGGNVGIGTTTPAEFVHVRRDQNAPTHLMVENTTAGALAYADLKVKNNLGHFNQFGLYSSTTTAYGALAAGNAFTYTTSPAMVIMADNGSGIIKFATGGFTERMRIDASGNVGIGTTTPNSSYKLDINGSANVTGSLNATGAITGGTINAKYQDVAEWVQSSQQLSAGTVVVLDHTKSNQVIASSQAYDTRVAGVISLQPGIALGENGAGKVLVATTGRVKVKVDATAGPIQVGDLLVTSDKEGIARKSEPLSLGGVQIHRPGTLIGKALEPLEKGTREILVLLSLQ